MAFASHCGLDDRTRSTRSTAARRAVRGGTGRGGAGPRHRRSRRSSRLRAPPASRRRADRRAARRSAHSDRDGRRDVFDEVAHRPASRLVRHVARDAAAARQSGRRRPGVRAPARCCRSRHDADPHVRSRRRHRRAVHRDAACARKIAILREQGVNGQVEMAAAFDRAGFDAVDVHMSDLLAGRAGPGRVQGPGRRAAASRTATCWAPAKAGPRSILFNAARPRAVRALLRAPGHLRPRRVQRLPDDEQPEASSFRAPRTGRASCATSRSSSKRGGDGAGRAVAVDVLRRAWLAAHCRSRSRTAKAARVSRRGAARPPLSRLTWRCASSTTGQVTETLSRTTRTARRGGITGLTTADGRVTIMMPHPERVIRSVQISWHSEDWNEDVALDAHVP